MEEFIQDRRVAICRELTKTHEEVLRGTAKEHIAHFTENEPRGEFVLVIEGSKEKTSRSHNEEATANDIFNKFNELSDKYASEGICRKKNDIIKEVAAFFNIPKNQAYDMYETVNQQTQGGL